MFHILATGGRSSTVQGDSFFYKTKFFIVYFPFKLVNNKGCMLNISRGFSFLKFCSCIFEKKSAFTRICINNKWVNRSLCGYRDKVGSSGAAQEANKLRAEVAAPSWKSCIFVMFLHNRLHLLLPRQGNIKKEGCKKFELVSGAHLLWEKCGVGRPRLQLVYESFVLTAIVHESHFISAAPWECTCLWGVCWRVGGRHHPFSGYYVRFRRI